MAGAKIITNLFDDAMRVLAQEVPEAVPGIRALHATPHEFKPAYRVLDKETGKIYVQPKDEKDLIDVLQQNNPGKYEIVDESDLGFFDLGKVGTGEGAQAFGHGLYFSDDPKVSGLGGRYWNDFLGRINYGDKRDAVLTLRDFNFNKEKALAYLDERRKKEIMQAYGPNEIPYGIFGADIDKSLARYDKIIKDILSEEPLPMPRVYEVNINARPEQLLDYTKPIKEQSPYVLNALNVENPKSGAMRDRVDALNAEIQRLTATKDYSTLEKMFEPDPVLDALILERDELSKGLNYALPPDHPMYGKTSTQIGDMEVHQLIRPYSRREHSVAASEALANAGIPGLHYPTGLLSGGLRNPDAKNYVVFDPTKVDIVNKFAQGGRIAKAGAGAVVGDVVEAALRLAGKELPAASSVTDDALKLAERERQARSMLQGYNVDAWTGSPRDIHRFEYTYSNPQGHYGPNHYFSSDQLDVNTNYAHPSGADLKNRTENLVEQYGDDYSNMEDEILSALEQKGKPYETIYDVPDADIEDAMTDIVRGQLGVTNEGAVYPVKLRMQNPVRVGGKNETVFTYNDPEFDEAGNLVAEPTGTLVDFAHALRDTAYDYGLEPEVAEGLFNELMSREFPTNASHAEYDIRKLINNSMAYDDNGEYISPGSIIADAYKRMGYDSIDMGANQAFPGMTMGPDTRHYIKLDPTGIRSRFAKFDPDQINSTDIDKASGGRIAKAPGGRLTEEALEALLRLARKEVANNNSAMKVIEGGIENPLTSTAAARAAENARLIKEAERLGYDPSNIDQIREAQKLQGFHTQLMGEVADRAKTQSDLIREYIEQGKFPLEVGTRYQTSKGLEQGALPWEVTGYYVDPKNPAGRYGYYVRRGDEEGGMHMIRDPKLEQIHGPERWEQLQADRIPMFGPRVVKAYGGAADDADIEAALMTANEYANGGRIAKAGAGAVEDAVTALVKKLLSQSGPEYSRTFDDLAAKGLQQSGYKPKFDYAKPLEDYSVVLKDKGTLQPWSEVDLSKLVSEGASVYPALGDRSAAGKFVTEIGGAPLTKPVNLQAGGDFGRSEFGIGDDAAYWASRPPAANRMIDRLINDQLREEGPSYMTHVAMGYPNLDSTHMLRQGVVRAIPARNIAAKDLADFNETIRKKYPDFPGIENTDEAEAFLDKLPGSKSAEIMEAIDRAKFINAGFPSLHETRWAISEPRLMDVPPLSAGYSIGQVGTKGAVGPRALVHETYGKQIPLIGDTAGLKSPVPLSLMFPDWWKTVKPDVQGNTTWAQQTLMTQFPRQKATQEWLDNIKAYEEAHQKVFGYSQGGEVDDGLPFEMSNGGSPHEYAHGGGVYDDADIEAAMMIAQRDHKAPGGWTGYGDMPELQYGKEPAPMPKLESRFDRQAMIDTGDPFMVEMATSMSDDAINRQIAFAKMQEDKLPPAPPAPKNIEDIPGFKDVSPVNYNDVIGDLAYSIPVPRSTPEMEERQRKEGADMARTASEWTIGPALNIALNAWNGREVPTEDKFDAALNIAGGKLFEIGGSALMKGTKAAYNAGSPYVKAAYEAARPYAKEIAAGLGIGALVANPSEAQAGIIGEGLAKGSSALMDALNLAKKMKDEGASVDEIWNATKWYQKPTKKNADYYGLDNSYLKGHWKTYLDPKEAKFDPTLRDKAVPLPDVLDFPELYALSPKIKDEMKIITAQPGMSGGMYHPPTKTISIGDVSNPYYSPFDADPLQNVAAHELQHGLQHAENNWYDKWFSGTNRQAAMERAKSAARIWNVGRKFGPRVKKDPNAVEKFYLANPGEEEARNASYRFSRPELRDLPIPMTSDMSVLPLSEQAMVPLDYELFDTLKIDPFEFYNLKSRTPILNMDKPGYTYPADYVPPLRKKPNEP